MNKKKTTFIILFITVLIYCLIGFCCYDLKSKNKELFILKNFNNDSKVVNSEKDNDNDQNEYLDQFNNDDYYLSIKAKANALKNIEKNFI